MRCALLVAFVAACGGEAATVDGVVDQIDVRIAIIDPPELLLLVVDDSATAVAATLRRVVADTSLPDTLEWLAQTRAWGLDITAWRPIDLRVFVLHPGLGSLVGPVDVPELALKRANATPEERTVLLQAVRREIVDRVAPPGARYSLLEQVDRAYRLLDRRRAPKDEHEAALVAALPPTHIDIGVATARDDESAGSPDDFTKLDDVTDMLIASCGDAVLPRVAAYGKTHRAWEIRPLCTSPAGALSDLLVESGIADYVCWATPRPVLRDAHGYAACRVTVSAMDLASCDAARGWVDPVVDGRRQAAVDSMGVRTCEVAQATGPSLDACRRDDACAGCSAYCLTDVGTCDQPQPRFMGGALPIGVGFAQVEIACDLEP